MGAVESLRNAVLDAALRNTAFSVTQMYLSLHTADPGTTGANEVTPGANTYARQQIEFDAASGGQSVNTNEERFDDMPAETVTHVGLWDAVSAGNFQWKGSMTVNKTLDAGDNLVFAAGDITVPTSGA